MEGSDLKNPTKDGIDKASLQEIIKGFQIQLDDIFKSNQLTQDYTILKGFVSFVQSKIQSVLENNFQRALEESKSNDGVSDIDFIPFILDLTWESIWYPIFKWFQSFRKVVLRSSANKNQPSYTELRKFTSKVKKFSNSVADFYMNTILMFHNNVDTSSAIPKFLSNNLNLESRTNPSPASVEYNSKFAALLIRSYHRCLIYLGSLHRYKALCEKFNNRYVVDDFNKSLQYFDFAILLCPSVGETYFQKGLIYMQMNKISKLCVNNIIGCLVPLRSRSALININNLFSKRDSSLHKAVLEVLSSIHKDDLIGSKIVNREIIEYYTIVLLGYNLQKESWIDNQGKSISPAINSIGLKHLELTLYEKISTRYIKNIELIYHNIISVIGSYHLIDTLKMGCDEETVKQSKIDYLKFAFSFISIVLEKVVIDGWTKNIETSEYLSIARIILNWVQADKDVLAYANSNSSFTQLVATLLNDILDSKYLSPGDLETKIPRTYMLEDDILLNSLPILRKSYSEFDDSSIISASDRIDRLSGQIGSSEKLDKIGESTLRMKSIIKMGSKVLLKNTQDITWDENTGKYKFTKTRKRTKLNNRESFQGDDNRYSSNGAFNINNDRIPKGLFSKEIINNAQTKRNNHSYVTKNVTSKNTTDPNKNNKGQSNKNIPVYSGSSVVAPETFNIKPSIGLANKVEEPGVTEQYNNNILSDNISSTNYKNPATPLEVDAPLDMATIESALRELTKQEVNEPTYQEPLSNEAHSFSLDSQPSSIPSIPTTPYSNTMNHSQSQLDQTLYYPNHSSSNGTYAPSSTGLMYMNNIIGNPMEQNVTPTNNIGFMNEPHQMRGPPNMMPNVGMNFAQHSNYINFGSMGSQALLQQPNMPAGNSQGPNMWGGSQLLPNHNMQQIPAPPPQHNFNQSQSPQQQHQHQHQYYPYSNMSGTPQW
ncbi:similar to Saccharomyces cerevisiae YDR206W EBS1 Protein involved in inhibition of translation and nonsense-mediated decay [Maudiozyma barnettii]|uniref:Nonsense-mediated mRNA decay factor n=1 Tax=Maudiozyma barnettii TaxID=61262 RepID=A0A8H2ZHP9_9SACH|nr:Ebs1p [Kazachstania barnettii]CAB4255008.1 similar to Saccharomyces cerevisiae YDR206W EBS1 Protein involved in inhibition of translation and nonsense-mediated decay [Kazachstania barnettii]CAD1783279.1 similar to Saccharomyces cerevisiae YDR206W EBS1 Protein involved in inhibition of translation and nonsense-mediated decay [Kazachstania barnettii]